MTPPHAGRNPLRWGLAPFAAGLLSLGACATTPLAKPPSATTAPSPPPATSAAPVASTAAPAPTVEPPLPASCREAPKGAEIPDTPAGRAFAAWLTAFDSGERACVAAFDKRYRPDGDLDDELDFRSQTGGFDLVAVIRSEPTRLTVRLRERGGRNDAVAKLVLKSADPILFDDFPMGAIRRDAIVEDVALDAAMKRRVIDRTLLALKASYVFPETAAKMEAAIHEHDARGDYRDVTDADDFAVLLTRHLRDVSHDKHLRVSFSAARPPPAAEKNERAEQEEEARSLQRSNCEFEKVERLSADIGYLKFNEFGPPDVCGVTAAAAMTLLADTRAIILDLRENHGGYGEMIDLLSSYLFAKKTHLNDIYDRPRNKTVEHWTKTNVRGRTSVDKPVFVLTSRHTFSAAEELAYDLQSQKRATIVGEVTGGGAHPIRAERIDDHFEVLVPFARAINPITKTNWEGVGVQPDVKVDAADALTTALKLATEATEAR